MSDDAWQDARKHFDTAVLPLLRGYGSRIAEDALAGNDAAERLIIHYKMLHRSFDPMTAHLIEKDLEEWLKTATPSQAAPGS